jgi:hypothetical protein
MAAPWNTKIHRASPRQWLIRRLAGHQTVILNAKLGVRGVESPEGPAVAPCLLNPEGDTLVDGFTGRYLAFPEDFIQAYGGDR